MGNTPVIASIAASDVRVELVDEYVAYKSIFSDIGDIFSELGNIASDVENIGMEVAGPVINIILSQAGSILSNMLNFIAQELDLSSIINTLMDKLSSALILDIDTVFTFIMNAIRTILSSIDKLVNDLFSDIAYGIRKLKTASVEIINTVESKIKIVIASIERDISSIVKDLKNKIANIKIYISTAVSTTDSKIHKLEKDVNTIVEATIRDIDNLNVDAKLRSIITTSLAEPGHIMMDLYNNTVILMDNIRLELKSTFDTIIKNMIAIGDKLLRELKDKVMSMASKIESGVKRDINAISKELDDSIIPRIESDVSAVLTTFDNTAKTIVTTAKNDIAKVLNDVMGIVKIIENTGNIVILFSQGLAISIIILTIILFNKS